MTDKKVLTLQDISCFGQCSLTVALPVLSACGIETIILPSAVLSTHTGEFTGYTFRDLTDDIPGIMNHWQKENLKFDYLYTGYLGSITQIEYVLELRKNVIKDEGLLIVDPAMADFGRLYTGFDDDFVAGMAGLCGKADIILPNLTEAAFMTGLDAVLDNHSKEYIDELMNRLISLGSKNVILKGISFEENKIGVAVFNGTSTEYYFTEKLPKGSHGTGDCYAAAFTGAIAQGRSLLDAASIAADFVVECLKNTINDESHWYGVKFEKALPLLVKELNN